MKYSELFEPEPEKWGFRGDPFLWREMKEYFGNKEIPDNQGELQHSLFKYCSDRCKVSLNMAESAYVEDFDKGGMTSGQISCKWWRETGLPLLFSRCDFPPTYYDYFYVFYKTDNTPGWNIAIITISSGTTIEKKIKRHRDWIETRVFKGTQFEKYYYLDSFPLILAPGTMHQHSSWIYNLELKKYFLPDEIITVPSSKAKQDFFNYEIMLKDDLDDDLDNLNLDLDAEYDWDVSKGNKNCFSFRPILKINDSVKIYLRFCDCFFELISNLYCELKTNKYAFIKINDTEYFKFLLWDCGEKIRFKIQDYNIHTQVEEPVDIEMPKSEFFEKFNEMFEELQKNLDSFKQKFNRCTETIGNISYKQLNYDCCTNYIKNKKWIDHASLFENEEHKSIELSLLMNPNYKTIKQQIEEVENWTEEERKTYKTRYYVDDSDFVWAVNQGKVFSYNYVEDRFIPSNTGIDLMKWHEISERELQKAIEEKKWMFK